MLVWETLTLTCWNISLWIVRVHLRELYRKRGKVGVIPHPARPPPPLSSQNFLLPPLIKILPHQPLKKCLTYIQETTSSQNLGDEPTRVQECYEGSQKRVCGICPPRGRGVPRIADLFPQKKNVKTERKLKCGLGDLPCNGTWYHELLFKLMIDDQWLEMIR